MMFPTAYVGKKHPRWTGLRSRVGWGVVTLRFSFIFLSFVLIFNAGRNLDCEVGGWKRRKFGWQIS